MAAYRATLPQLYSKHTPLNPRLHDTARLAGSGLEDLVQAYVPKKKKSSAVIEDQVTKLGMRRLKEGGGRMIGAIDVERVTDNCGSCIGQNIYTILWHRDHRVVPDKNGQF